jgi:two-component system NtrC family sensor kinase
VRLPDGFRLRSLLRRLDLRLALAACLGAALILLAAGAWSIRAQRRQMTSLVAANASGTADTILRATREAMLAYDPEGLARLVRTIGAQPGFERIRIFDKQGRIQTSTEPADVGTLVDKQAEQCFACHSADEPLHRLEGVERVRTFEQDDGSPVLGVIAPIRNEPDCSNSGCHAHPPERQVLGVLDVQLSLGPVESQLASAESHLGLGLAVTVAALLLLVGSLVWRMVLRPVRKLERATARVAAGDLAVRAPVLADDEIGQLTGSWNTMVAELARTRDELERWSRTLEERVEEKTRELQEAHRRIVTVEKMASLGRLAAGVAHELNNPLAGIATYARLLHRRLPPPAEGQPEGESGKALALMEREAVRCGDIVKNLLLFSRSAGARFAPERLGVLFERVALLVRHKAELQEVRVACEAAPDLPAVECDGAQLQQALLALAVNAIEAMPHGGQLLLRAWLAGGEAAIEVRDTGAGIAEADLPHVFEPFFSTKEEGKGVGLGLSVVYGIVQRHHARIDVQSRPGQGTTFTIRLPLRQPADCQPAAPAPAEVAS